jgi:hypothetical protein
MMIILFYILIALFPLGALVRFSLFPSINIAAQDIVVVFILMLSIKMLYRGIKKISKIVRGLTKYKEKKRR